MQIVLPLIPRWPLIRADIHSRCKHHGSVGTQVTTMESPKTLLVANRGEIAVRILKTAKYGYLHLWLHETVIVRS